MCRSSCQNNGPLIVFIVGVIANNLWSFLEYSCKPTWNLTQNKSKPTPQPQIPQFPNPNKVIKFSQPTHTTTAKKKKKKLYPINTYQPKIHPDKKGKFSATEEKIIMSDFEIHRRVWQIYGGNKSRTTTFLITYSNGKSWVIK